MSDRIAVMFEGEIAQLATPQTLYRRPKNRRVAEFIGVMNFMSASALDVGDRRIDVDVAGLGACQIDAEQSATDVTRDATSVGIRPENTGHMGRAVIGAIPDS